MNRVQTMGGTLLAIATMAFSAQLAVGADGKAQTVLVSRADGRTGQAAQGLLQKAWISGNGRHVAFLSNASNIGSVEPTIDMEIFLRDVAAGATTPLSTLLGGVKPNHVSFSASGRYLAYDVGSSFEGEDAESTPSPVHHDFIAERGQVYVFDLLKRRHTLVSRASGKRGQAANSLAFEPSISANGRYVAFVSASTNLTREPSGQRGREKGPQDGIYVRDLRAGTTTLASRANGTNGEAPNLPSSEPSISANGRFVAFTSTAALGVRGLPREEGELAVFRRDLAKDRTTLVSQWGRQSGKAGFASAPAISADGRRIAYYGIAADPPGAGAAPSGPLDDPRTQAAHGGFGPVTEGSVYVRDMATGKSTLVSRKSGQRGQLLTGSNQPSISGGGRFVVFQSSSPVLSPDVAPMRRLNVLLRDTRTNRTVLVKKSGEQPQISANGRFVLFDSEGLGGNAFRNTPAHGG
jgi:Tol biopolymer transport system component